MANVDPKARKSSKLKQPGFFTRMRASLNKGDSWLTYDLRNLLPGETVDQDALDELETQLLLADVGVEATGQVMHRLQVMFDGGRLRTGKDLGKAPFDLVEVARSLTSDMASTILASGRGISFESAHQRWDCYGTVALVHIALRNLLENAVRHTPPGSEILVSIETQGHLAVNDDGPGVPQTVQSRLFQRFSKADTQSPGAGLGLSIIHRVMVLHGGEARLDPTYDGARFVLDFSQRGG